MTAAWSTPQIVQLPAEKAREALARAVSKRQRISKKLRFEVFKRDGFRCAYCGAVPANALLECDHINPVSRGGHDGLDNLITACFDCNRGKRATPLSFVPQSLSERASEVLEREAQIAAFQRIMKKRRMRLEADAEKLFEAFCSSFAIDKIPMRDFSAIKNFVDKLGFDECLGALEKASLKVPYCADRAFRYFCGICWNKIRDLGGEK
jgi:HNH endonuclease